MTHGDLTDQSSSASIYCLIESLQNSQRQFLLCITLAPLSIAMFDRDMRYLAASRHWLQNYARGYSDLIGLSHYEVHPDLPERWKEIHRRGLAGETLKNDEDLWVQADGSMHWLRWSVTPWQDMQGEIGGIIISAENITERKQAETALRNSEEYFRTLFEQATDGILVSDAQERFIEVNTAACRQLGYLREDLLNMSISDLLVPEEASRLASEITRLSQGEVMRREWHMRRKDGSVFFCEVTSKQLPDGRLQRFLRDITQARRAQALLQERQHFLQRILDAEPACVGLIDAQGTVLEMNAAGLAIMEAKNREQVIGKYLAQFVVPEHRKAFVQLQQRAVEGTGGTLRFDIIGLQGTRCAMETHVVPFRDSTGAVIATLSLTTDITERRRIAAENQRLALQLQQAQKMEAISRLTAGFAHDFNNILASILGYSGLALEQHVPDKSGKLADFLREIQNAGICARDLIADMLAFLHSGRTKREPVLLESLVQEAAKTFEPLLPPSITFEVRIETDDIHVLAEPAQLHQVIMNLIINARDAAGEHGSIALAIRSTHGVNAICDGCHGNVTGDFVELAVSDNGPGIPPDILPRIFNPFYTAQITGKNTGMGLSMVHGVIHNSGGHIVIDSLAGSGTTIRVMLPKADTLAASMTGVPTAAEHAVKNNGHILVVDDEEVLAHLFAEILKTHGYQVTVFSDSREALRRFYSTPAEFDAVISDQTMPGLTGVELAHALRVLRPELPIILCTGYSAALNPDIAARLRVAFLSKPVSFDALLLTLEQALAGTYRLNGKTRDH